MTRPVISFNLGATFNEPHILLPGAPANPQETIMSAGINAIAAAAGAVPHVRMIDVVFRNPDVDTVTVPETVWPLGGLVALRATAAVVEVVSSDAADAAAGTGVSSVYPTVPHPFEEKTDIEVIVSRVAANDTLVTLHGRGLLIGPNADL